MLSFYLRRFPEITLCVSEQYKLDILNQNGIPTKRDMQFKANWVSNDSNISPVDLLQNASFSFEDVVISLKISTAKPMNGTNLPTSSIVTLT